MTGAPAHPHLFLFAAAVYIVVALTAMIETEVPRVAERSEALQPKNLSCSAPKPALLHSVAKETATSHRACRVERVLDMSPGGI